MANQRNSNQRRASAQSAQRSRSSDAQRRRPAAGSSQSRRRSQDARRRQQRSGFDITRLLRSLRPKAEFKPDAPDRNLSKKLFLTQVQRDTFTKWGLYIGLMVLLMMIQDVIMSQVSIFGATTDLVVCIILLITVIEGIEIGSIFVLVSSCFYYFSGSSPGPWCVGIMTFLGIGACLFRQLYWHRNRGSIVLCAGLALMLYELGIFIVGIFTNLTRWDRMMHFVITGALSVALMIPLYSLINAIGQIGGNTWKE